MLQPTMLTAARHTHLVRGGYLMLEPRTAVAHLRL